MTFDKLQFLRAKNKHLQFEFFLHTSLATVSKRPGRNNSLTSASAPVEDVSLFLAFWIVLSSAIWSTLTNDQHTKLLLKRSLSLSVWFFCLGRLKMLFLFVLYQLYTFSNRSAMTIVFYFRSQINFWYYLGKKVCNRTSAHLIPNEWISFGLCLKCIFPCFFIKVFHSDYYQTMILYYWTHGLYYAFRPFTAFILKILTNVFIFSKFYSNYLYIIFIFHLEGFWLNLFHRIIFNKLRNFMFTTVFNFY